MRNDNTSNLKVNENEFSVAAFNAFNASKTQRELVAAAA